jgi:O-antigen/teichoic acid export membrane protein
VNEDRTSVGDAPVAIETLTGASVAASTAGSLAMYVLVKARGLVLVPLYAWLLHPADVGVVNLAAAIATLIAPFLHLGLPTGLLVELPHQRSREDEARGHATALGLVTMVMLISAVGIPFAVRAVAGSALADVRPHAFAITFFAIGLALRDVGQIVPQLRRETRYLAVLSIAIEYGSAALGLGLVAAGGGPGGLLWGTAIVMIAGALAAVRRSRALTGPAAGRDPAFLRRALGIGLPMLAITTAYTLVQSADRFFLARYQGPAAVGVYSIGYTVASAVLALAATVNLVFLPVAVKLLSGPPARLTAFIQESLRFLILALGLCVSGAFLCGAPAVRALAGPAYDMAGRLLPYMVIAYSLFTIGQLLQWVPMAVTRRVRGVVASHSAVAALNIVLGAVLIPHHGMWGAVAASVASYATGAVLMAVVARSTVRSLRVAPTLRAIALVVIASLACSRVPLAPSASIAAAMAAAVVLVIAYVALGVGIGAIRRRDFDLVRSVMRGVLPEEVPS